MQRHEDGPECRYRAAVHSLGRSVVSTSYFIYPQLSQQQNFTHDHSAFLIERGLIRQSLYIGDRRIDDFCLLRSMLSEGGYASVFRTDSIWKVLIALGAGEASATIAATVCTYYQDQLLSYEQALVNGLSTSVGELGASAVERMAAEGTSKGTAGLANDEAPCVPDGARQNMRDGNEVVNPRPSAALTTTQLTATAVDLDDLEIEAAVACKTVETLDPDSPEVRPAEASRRVAAISATSIEPYPSASSAAVLSVAGDLTAPTNSIDAAKPKAVPSTVGVTQLCPADVPRLPYQRHIMTCARVRPPHAPTWEVLAAYAMESQRSWKHPVGSRQVETESLHICRAIRFLPGLNISQLRMSRWSGLSQGTLSPYIRGLLVGNQRGVEERLNAFFARFCSGDFDGELQLVGHAGLQPSCCPAVANAAAAPAKSNVVATAVAPVVSAGGRQASTHNVPGAVASAGVAAPPYSKAGDGIAPAVALAPTLQSKTHAKPGVGHEISRPLKPAVKGTESKRALRQQVSFTPKRARYNETQDIKTTQKNSATRILPRDPPVATKSVKNGKKNAILPPPIASPAQKKSRLPPFVGDEPNLLAPPPSPVADQNVTGSRANDSGLLASPASLSSPRPRKTVIVDCTKRMVPTSAPSFDVLFGLSTDLRSSQPVGTRAAKSRILCLCRSAMSIGEPVLTREFMCQRAGVAREVLDSYLNGTHISALDTVELRLSLFIRRWCNGEFDSLLYGNARSDLQREGTMYNVS